MWMFREVAYQLRYVRKVRVQLPNASGGQGSDSCTEGVPGDHEAVIRILVDSFLDFRDHYRPSLFPRIPKALVNSTSIAEVCRCLDHVKVREPILFRSRSPERKDDDLMHVVDGDESGVICPDGVLELGNGRGIRRLDELAISTRASDLGSRRVIVARAVSCGRIPGIELELRQKLFANPVVLRVLGLGLGLSTTRDDPGPVETTRALLERHGESRERGARDQRRQDGDQGTGEDQRGGGDSDRGCRNEDRKPESKDHDHTKKDIHR